VFPGSELGKASSLAGAADLRDRLYDGFVLNLHMTFSFIPERYWRAAMRSAYLAVFNAEGLSTSSAMVPVECGTS
jgi:hypothetical protein